MKKQSTTLFNQLGKQSVITLTTIVNETLHLNYEFPGSTTKIFTAAHLWKIQRNKKAMVQRRGIF